MGPRQYLQCLYERFGAPGLANFTLSELDDDATYQFGAFVLADHGGQVVLIRRTPIKKYPGIEDYWWIPGGAREADEELDETAIREFREETGLTCSVQRIILAQLAEDRPFIAVFFRGTVIGGVISSDADPDSITAEAATFSPGTVRLGQLWTDADKILLVEEGFATGEVENLITTNKLERKHNRPGSGDL